MHDRLTALGAPQLMKCRTPQHVVLDFVTDHLHQLEGGLLEYQGRVDAVDQHGGQHLADLLDLVSAPVDDRVARHVPQLAFPLGDECGLVFDILVFILVVAASLDHHDGSAQVAK